MPVNDRQASHECGVKSPGLQLTLSGVIHVHRSRWSVLSNNSPVERLSPLPRGPTLYYGGLYRGGGRRSFISSIYRKKLGDTVEAEANIDNVVRERTDQFQGRKRCTGTGEIDCKVI